MMAQRCMVGGNAYDIKGGKVNVNGEVFDIIKGRVMVEGKAHDILFSVAGTPIDAKAVGSSVYGYVDGVRTEYIIVHKGNPDTSIYDASCDGVWLMQKTVQQNLAWGGSSSNLYTMSAVKTYLEEDYLNLLDSNFKKHIKTAKIPYVSSANGTVSSGTNGLDVRAFLLSAREVGWTSATDKYFPSNGDCRSYFEGMSAIDAGRIVYDELGFGSAWWLRDTYLNGTKVVYVTSQGGPGNVAPTQKYGVRPVVIVDCDMQLDENNNIIG